MPHDEHGNFCPVLTLIPDLFRNEFILRKTLDFSGPKLPPLLTFLQGVVETILVKERRVGEARKGDEEPRVLSFAPDGGLSDELWSEPSDAFSILEIVDVNLVFDLSWHRSISCSLFFFFRPEGEQPTYVSLVHDDKMVLDQNPDLEFRILLFGDQVLPCEFWIRNIDRDDLLSRCVLIGQQVEERTIVSDASGGKEGKGLESKTENAHRMRGTDMS